MIIATRNSKVSLPTRKKNFILSPVKEGTIVETFGTWWDGGSRAEYFTLDIPSQRVARINASTNPTEFGGQMVTAYPSKGKAIIKGGVSCGKPATLVVTCLEEDAHYFGG